VQQGDQLVIHGVVSPRLPPFAYEPILVPAAYGHYVETFTEVLPTLTASLTSVGEVHPLIPASTVEGIRRTPRPACSPG
jgi:hypothetical protein